MEDLSQKLWENSKITAMDVISIAVIFCAEETPCGETLRLAEGILTFYFLVKNI